MHKFKLFRALNDILHSYIQNNNQDQLEFEQIKFNENSNFAKLLFYADKYREKLKIQINLIFNNNDKLVRFTKIGIIKLHQTEYDISNKTVRNYLNIRKNLTDQELRKLDCYVGKL